jgi:hypothetical protein
MADYHRSRVSVVYSANADYSDPMVQKSFETEYTTADCLAFQHGIINEDGWSYVRTYQFTTVHCVTVHNHGTANSLYMWVTPIGSTAKLFEIPPGETLRLPGIVANDDISFDNNGTPAVFEGSVIVVATY